MKFNMPSYRCTSIAHRTCVHKKLDYFFELCYFGRFHFVHFKPKRLFINDYQGH